MTEQHSDVVDELPGEHRAVRELLDDIIAGGDPQHRRDVVDTVIAEVVRHAVAEQSYLHLAVCAHLPGGDGMVGHDFAEDEGLERVLTHLEHGEATGPDFDRLVLALHAAWGRHVEHQERHRFPQLREHVPAEEQAALGAQVQRVRRAAPARPDPQRPDAELVQALVGSGVGMVNRLRARLTDGPPDEVDPVTELTRGAGPKHRARESAPARADWGLRVDRSAPRV